MKKNAELLKKTVKDIEEERFAWDQGVWAEGGFVKSGIDFDDLASECGTRYCFAGRVASITREQLYYYDSTWYTPTASFAALDSDPEYMAKPLVNTLYRAVRNKNGKLVFERYKGRVVDAQDAARYSLGLNATEAGILFDGYNNLDAVKEAVEAILEGAYESLE